MGEAFADGVCLSGGTGMQRSILEKRKKRKKKTVCYNCANPPWDVTMNNCNHKPHRLMRRDINSLAHTQTRTCLSITVCIWIKANRRGESSKLVYMQIFQCWGDEKSQLHGKTWLLFLPSDQQNVADMNSCLHPTATKASFVAPSQTHRFAGSTKTLKRTHIKPLIYVLLFRAACCVSFCCCVIALSGWNKRLIFLWEA